MNKFVTTAISATLLICIALARAEGPAVRRFTNSVGLLMVQIEPGTFTMGADGDRDHWTDRPPHQVTLSNPFFISATEVTREAFREFHPDFRGNGRYAPYAAGVSWNDAQAFCEWLSRREGKPYRLPTEAEWEYEAQAGWNPRAKPEAEQANTLGVKNMLTGVREWCWDWFGEYSSAPQTDPIGPRQGFVKVVRGGALDLEERNVPRIDFYTPHSRLAVGPGFGVYEPGAQDEIVQSQATAQSQPGEHAIGFRIVQAALPPTEPSRPDPPLVLQFVKQVRPALSEGPDPSRPYFRKRYLLPSPPENSSPAAIDAAGMHPSFRGHNHSPGLEVLPNGDLLLVIYTSYNEYEPGVSLIASRLRFGAEEWDFPSRLVDEVGINDHAPLLWTDKETVHLFWGHPMMEEGAFPFQSISSSDSGATWSEIRYPMFRGPIGDHSRQPINSAFRGTDGTIYVASDGAGGRSLLWASADNGKTWYDTGGRTAGRHTTFAVLKDGSILGLGGKNTDIDGFMPRVISHDGGKTWAVAKSPFPRLGTNQRPTLIRLRSGRLFFAGDFVLNNDGSQPAGINQLGCYVALSDDEGQTWRFKKLIGAQLHENLERAERMRGPTLGYSVARQAPNGLIHLITTMNNPCLHFEFNEAWILNDPRGERSDRELMSSSARQVLQVRTFEEKYPSGQLRARWSGGQADDGRFLLHGVETWFHPDGSREYEAAHQLGRKIGKETAWTAAGKIAWSCEHDPKTGMVRTEYWPDGRKKSETSWENFHAKGVARLWDPAGKLVSEKKYDKGKILN